MRRLSFTANPPWRIDNLEGSPSDWAVQAPLTRVPSANGVSPLALENIIQLRLFLHDGDPWGWYYPVDHLDSPVLDLLNVRYLVASGEGVARVAALNRFRHAASLPGQEVFENRAVLPRFFLVHDARAVKSLDEARGIIAGGIDFSKTAIVEAPLQLSPVTASGEQVHTVFYEPDALEVEATAASDALLVLADNDYPGWRAWIDGRQSPIHPTDIAFRGVAVPAGTHRIRMEFHPVILTWSLALSFATAMALLVLALKAYFSAGCLRRALTTASTSA